ncbi:hypothetical protein RYX36_003028, partial [Vicia faba]
DYVLVERFCLQKYKFSHGDVVIFRSPLNYKETHIKRILPLPNEWYVTRHNNDILRIPEGHCWVEGDNAGSSMDSKSYGAKLVNAVMCGSLIQRRIVFLLNSVTDNTTLIAGSFGSSLRKGYSCCVASSQNRSCQEH